MAVRAVTLVSAARADPLDAELRRAEGDTEEASLLEDAARPCTGSFATDGRTIYNLARTAASCRREAERLAPPGSTGGCWRNLGSPAASGGQDHPPRASLRQGRRGGRHPGRTQADGDATASSRALVDVRSDLTLGQPARLVVDVGPQHPATGGQLRDQGRVGGDDAAVGLRSRRDHEHRRADRIQEHGPQGGVAAMMADASTSARRSAAQQRSSPPQRRRATAGSRVAADRGRRHHRLGKRGGPTRPGGRLGVLVRVGMPGEVAPLHCHARRRAEGDGSIRHHRGTRQPHPPAVRRLYARAARVRHDVGYRVMRALFHEHAFDVERKTMVAALGRYWQGRDNAACGRPLPAFGEAVQRLAREGAGGMLSNGVAVLPRATLLPSARVAWRAQRGDFETA
jgi:hypothetical protein